MKARVIKTGEIIEISEDCSYLYAENYDKAYNLNELEFLDVKEKSLPKNEPDYWEKLKHQAAISAMQGIINNDELLIFMCEENTETTISDTVTSNAIIVATKLVNKLKEEYL